MWNILVFKSWIFHLFHCCRLCSRHCLRYVSGNVTGSTTNKIPHLPGTYILSTSLRFETWLNPPTHWKSPLLSGQVRFQDLRMYFQGKDTCCSMCNPVHCPGAKLPRKVCGSPGLPPCPSRLAPPRQEVYPFLLISQFPPSSRVLAQT